MTYPIAGCRGQSRVQSVIDYPARWGLISCWELEEASGTREDAHGTNDLTDNNTVTQVAGVVGNAAKFTAVSLEYLSIADNASISTGDIDFWLSCWVYFDSGIAIQAIIAKGDTLLAAEYTLFRTVTDELVFLVGNGINSGSVSAAITGGTWHFVLAWHDAANNTVNFKVDGGSTVSAAYASGGQNSDHPLHLGATFVPLAFLNGRIDQACFGKSPAGGVAGIIDEIGTRIYNGGSGRFYPFA